MSYSYGRSDLEGEDDRVLAFDPFAFHRLAIRSSADRPVGLILPPGQAFAAEQSVGFSLCSTYPVVSPASSHAMAKKPIWFTEETRLGRNPVCESDDLKKIKALIRNGVGISLLSSIDVVEEVQAGALVFVPLDHRRIHNFMWGFCVDQARSLPVAARRVAQALEAGLPELVLSRSGCVSGDA